MIPLGLTDEDLARVAAAMAEQGVPGPYTVDGRQVWTVSTGTNMPRALCGNRHERRASAKGAGR